MIFIPCSSYNINEDKGNNHFNCPVVAYYGEVIKGNQDTEGVPLMLGYLSLESEKHLAKRISELFNVKKSEAVVLFKSLLSKSKTSIAAVIIAPRLPTDMSTSSEGSHACSSPRD